jgi:hypothetical protein
MRRVHRMSIVEIKQGISRLDPRGRREIQAYLLRLKHESSAWKTATAKRVKHMKAGRATDITGLADRLRRGQ